MRISVVVAVLAVLFSANLALAGGPDLRCKNASVESVEVDDSKIVMIVSGRCEMFLVDSKLPEKEGSAKFVATDLSHCVVTYVLQNEQLKGMNFSWKQFCEKAKSLVGKSAWLDLQGTVTVDSARVVSVRATGYGMGVAKAAND